MGWDGLFLLPAGVKGLFAGGPGDGFDGDGRHRRPVIEVDVFHGVVSIVVSLAMEVIILHEEDHGIPESQKICPSVL